MEEDEYITNISGTVKTESDSDSYISSLTFVTSSGQSVSFGGEDGTEFDFKLNEGEGTNTVVGLSGGTEELLSSIQAYYVDLDSFKDC